MQISDFHISDMIVKIVSAIVILVVTAFLAKLIKNVLSKQLAKVKALHRQTETGQSLAESLGSIASLVVWLFGLMAILNLFALTGVLGPLQVMLATMMAALPRIIGAALVLFIGIMLARVVRDLLVTALQAAGADRWLERGTAAAESAATGTSKRRRRAEGGATAGGATAGGAAPATTSAGDGPLVSTMLGQVVFTVIVLVVAIAALQVLGIAAISDPATHMLTVILAAIPVIVGAAILVAIGVVIARLVGGLLESLLRGFGLDRAAARLGLDSTKVDLAAVVVRVVQVAIVLFFAIAAANMLGFPQISGILGTVLAVGARVVFGAAIIAVGVWVANLLADLVSGKAGTIVRYGTILLFAAMGLKYMGLADSIINLAFGALVIGAALAAALAFGLGGRDAAARQLDRVQSGPDTRRS